MLAVLLVTCIMANSQILHSCIMMELVCGTMFDPGSNLQTTPPPYSIQVSKTEASPNDVIEVKLTTSSIDFNGIYVQGRRDNTGDDETPLGHYLTPPEEPEILLCDCGEGEDNAAVHINPFSPLQEVVLEYVVPENEPLMYFRAAMSWNMSTFWYVHSDKITIS